MQPTGAQTGIKVLSILAIIFGALGILLSLMAIAGGAILGREVELAGDTAQQLGVRPSDVGILAMVSGFFMFLSATLQLVLGIFGIRAASDNQKIMPVWVLSLIALIVAVINSISGILAGGDFTTIISSIAGLIIPVLFFWFANTVKKEAGK